MASCIGGGGGGGGEKREGERKRGRGRGTGKMERIRKNSYCRRHTKNVIFQRQGSTLLFTKQPLGCKIRFIGPGVVAHFFNPGGQEAETGRSLSSRPD